MRMPRAYIVPDNSIVHVIWRCFERRFYLKSNNVKDYVVSKLAKYKERYQIKIFDFNILDNHVHLLIMTSSAALLGAFMRDTNSVIARFVNKKFNRKGYVLDGRYLSPVVDNMNYLFRLLGYIWLNKARATGLDPSLDQYCSYYWRSRGLSHPLLDDYSELPFKIYGAVSEFVKNLLKSFIKEKFKKEEFTNNYMVGPKEALQRHVESLRKRFTSGEDSS